MAGLFFEPVNNGHFLDLPLPAPSREQARQELRIEEETVTLLYLWPNHSIQRTGNFALSDGADPRFLSSLNYCGAIQGL